MLYANTLLKMSDDAHFYRRSLPHWRKDGASYFVTWRLREGLPGLQADQRREVAAVLRHFQGIRYLLHAYVVMDDHVHVLVELLDGTTLQTEVHYWKSFTANRLQKNRRGAVWQREYFDRIVRDDAEYREKRDYILANPYRRWPETDGYQWVWALGLPW